jgi:predicted secreted protein
MFRFMLVAALTVLPLLALQAEEPREGNAYWQNVTQLNLTSAARRMVAPDRVTATLAIEHDAASPVAAQAFVNGKMQAAQAAASKVKGVKFETGSYSTTRNEPDEPKPLTAAERLRKTTWTTHQDVRLDSADVEALRALTATLQQMGFAADDLSYYLSRDKTEAVREELLTQALGDIRARATHMAEVLGMKVLRFARIDTGDEPGPIGARPMAFAGARMDKAMPMPVVTPGDTEVQVTVSAEVHLK